MINDSPIVELSQDQFNRKSFIDQIVKVIENKSISESFTIGLYEKWGTGKTSILKLIQNDLEPKGYVVLEFAPWLITDKEQIINLFFNEVRSQLKKSDKKYIKEIRSGLEKYQNILFSGLDFFGYSFIGKLLKILLKNKSSDKSLIEQKEELQKLFQKLDRKIIIYIDDLDRLDYREIEVIFKLIKVIADFKNTIYILPFDPSNISKALDRSFPDGGSKYLEKIIQLPLELPQTSDFQLFKFLNEKLDDLIKSHSLQSDNFKSQEIDEFLKYFISQAKTPRVVIRFINSLDVKIALMKGEVNMNDLFILEGINHIDKKLYNSIKYDRMIFLQMSNDEKSYSVRDKGNYNLEKRKVKLDSVIDVNNTKLLSILTTVFPQLNTVYSNYIYDNEHKFSWYQNKRLCSGRYFDKYFTYGIAENEISDVTFNNIINELNDIDLKNNDERLVEIISEIDIYDFIFKLSINITKYEAKEVRKLAFNLVLLNKYIKHEESAFSLNMDTMYQLIYILKDIIKVQPEKSKIELIAELVERSSNINFLTRFWVETRSFEDQPKKILTEIQANEVSKYFVDRILELNTIIDIIENSESISYSYSILAEICQVRGQEARSKVDNYINISNDHILKVIKMFSVTTHSSAPPYKYKSNFNETYYNLLKQCCDIKNLYEKSLALFGDLADMKINTKIDHALTDMELVAKFQKLYLTS